MIAKLSREVFIARARHDLEVQRDEARAASRRLVSVQEAEYKAYHRELRTRYLRWAHHAKRS